MRKLTLLSFLLANSILANDSPVVSAELAEMIEAVVVETGFNINITDFTSISANINLINGRDVCSDSAGEDVRKLQEAFSRHPDIHRNFGPAFYAVTAESGETKFLDREVLIEQGIVEGCTSIYISILDKEE